MTDFLKQVRERVVVYDGAMGTSIQVRQPSLDDFRGKEGCNELLSLSRPDIIRDIHASFFAVGIFLSTLIIVPIIMNFPLHGEPVEFKDYLAGPWKQHLLGVLGGLIWFGGMIANLAASSTPKSVNVGPAVAYALGQGATLISTFWGLIVWREFRGAPGQVKLLLCVMIALFVAGLALISIAPLN